jgi:hypothetical protein
LEGEESNPVLRLKERANPAMGTGHGSWADNLSSRRHEISTHNAPSRNRKTALDQARCFAPELRGSRSIAASGKTLRQQISLTGAV